MEQGSPAIRLQSLSRVCGGFAENLQATCERAGRNSAQLAQRSAAQDDRERRCRRGRRATTVPACRVI
eukprot:6197501-Pleurochrysis_carterae.AAC.3